MPRWFCCDQLVIAECCTHLRSMTHSEFRQFFYQSLTSCYLQGELMAMYHWCMEEIHGWNRARVYLANDDAVSEAHLAQWNSVIDRLKKQEPLQYIFSKAIFRNLELFVDANVLIPRPETEELVDLVLMDQDASSLSILDIGTGSGCIALSIKQERMNWTVAGCDVSEAALKVANQNAGTLALEVGFFRCDVSQSEAVFVRPSYDIIVSNPPYIRHHAEGEIEQNVKGHEPHIALFAPENDPFFFFRKITEHAVKLDVRQIYFETEALNISALIDELAALWNGSIKSVNDLAGKPRFIVLSVG